MFVFTPCTSISRSNQLRAKARNLMRRPGLGLTRPVSLYIPFAPGRSDNLLEPESPSLLHHLKLFAHSRCFNWVRTDCLAHTSPSR